MSDTEKDGCSHDPSWDHLKPCEAYSEGWSDGHAIAMNVCEARIAELEQERDNLLAFKDAVFAEIRAVYRAMRRAATEWE